MAAGTRPVGVPVYVGQLVQWGTVTAPVRFFDVDLPEGYSRFQFWVTGVTVSAADNVAAALYVGGRFECDPTHNDTYLTVPAVTSSSLIVMTPVQTHAPTPYRAGCLAEIYPGDLENLPVVAIPYAWASAGTLTLQAQSVVTLKNTATVPPSTGPATMIRILPKGTGNVNPPTSGETLNSGDWRLYAYN